MICPNCKNEIKENSKFCGVCGFKKTESAPVNEIDSSSDICIPDEQIKPDAFTFDTGKYMMYRVIFMVTVTLQIVISLLWVFVPYLRIEVYGLDIDICLPVAGVIAADSDEMITLLMGLLPATLSYLSVIVIKQSYALRYMRKKTHWGISIVFSILMIFSDILLMFLVKEEGLFYYYELNSNVTAYAIWLLILGIVSIVLQVLCSKKQKALFGNKGNKNVL